VIIFVKFLLNEIYISNGSPCQTTCRYFNKECEIHTITPISGCYCKNWFARDNNNICIKINSKTCQDIMEKNNDDVDVFDDYDDYDDCDNCDDNNFCIRFYEPQNQYIS
jgi:hypothetical protein